MLVKQLPDGPLDIVGDVHGELKALQTLLGVLGYSTNGDHPEGRKLVFIGDLTDRGPDSPGVVDFVDQLISEERGYCVLGNHDLNLLLGLRKHDNGWFFGETFEHEGQLVPQKLADDVIRARTTDLFKRLPIALERPGLRVIHAYWDTSQVDSIRDKSDIPSLHSEHEERIDRHCSENGLDKIDRGLSHQNDNPIKHLTSGPERRIDPPVEIGGKLRNEERVKWWEAATESDDLTVFGHYALGESVPRTRSAVCCDYGVAYRYRERIAAGFNGKHKLRLGALRVPENVIVFDDGLQQEL